MFELVPYDQIGNIKIPLVVGCRNSEIWEFYGVLTETGLATYELFVELFTHLTLKKDVFQSQALFSLKVVADEGVTIVSLKTLTVEGDGEQDNYNEVPLLPLFEILKDGEVKTLFTGDIEFHGNYPEFVKDMSPMVQLFRNIHPSE